MGCEFCDSESTTSVDEPTVESIEEWLEDLPLGTQFQRAHEAASNARHPGTGTRFVDTESFTEWADGSADNSLILLVGPGGVGKTTAAAAAVDALRERFADDNSVAVVAVYLDYQKRAEQTLERIYATIALELVKTAEELPEDFVDCSWPEWVRGDDDHKTADCMRTFVGQIMEVYERVFLILDGLDELETSALKGRREQLLRDVAVWQKEHSLSILATCEFEEEPFMLVFDGYDAMDISPDQDDIEKYIEDRFSTFSPETLGQPELPADTQQTLKDSAAKNFLTARLLLESLPGLTNEHSVREHLERASRCGASLNAAYELITQRINNQSTSRLELARKALSWIVQAKRQLSATELTQALAFNLDGTRWSRENVPDIDDLVSCCSGLVSIEPKTGEVRLLHKTALEYFEHNMKDWMVTERDMAMCCLTYIQLEDPGDAFLQYISCSLQEDERYLQEWPLAGYATQFWGLHARESQDDLDIQNAVLRLLGVRRPLSSLIQAPVESLRTPGGHHYSSEPSIALLTFFGLDQILDLMLKKEINRACATLDRQIKSAMELAIDQNHIEVLKVFFTFITRTGRTEHIRVFCTTGIIWHAVNQLHYEAMEAAINILVPSTSFRQRTLDFFFDHSIKKKNTSVARRIAARTDFSISPIMLREAISNGLTEVVEVLLQRSDMDPNIVDERGRTCLAIAAFWGRKCIFDVLLDTYKVEASIRDASGETALTLAVKEAYRDDSSEYAHIIQRLLQSNHGTELHIKDRDGQALLTHAVRSGNISVVKVLLEHMSDGLDTRDNSGRCLLSHAVTASGNSTDVLELLVNERDLPVNMPDNNGKTPLIWAVEAAWHPRALILFESGKDVALNASDCRGRTALFYAGKASHQTDTVDCLLAQEEIDPNIQDEHGRTALWYAWDIDSTYISGFTKILAHKKTNPNIQDSMGRTILIHKAECSTWALERILKDSRTDPNMVDGTGRTALFYAVSYHPQTVEALLLHEATDPNVLDLDGRTPLSHASELHNYQAVEHLLQHPKTLVDISDKSGLTPLDYAGIAAGPLFDRVAAPLIIRFLQETKDSVGHEGRARFFRKANKAPRGGSTTLSLAVQFGGQVLSELAKVLIQQPEIDVNCEDDMGETPFERATRHLDVEAMRLLLGRADLDPSKKDVRESLRSTIEYHRKCRDDESRAGSRLELLPEAEELVNQYLTREVDGEYILA